MHSSSHILWKEKNTFLSSIFNIIIIIFGGTMFLLASSQNFIYSSCSDIFHYYLYHHKNKIYVLSLSLSLYLYYLYIFFFKHCKHLMYRNPKTIAPQESVLSYWIPILQRTITIIFYVVLWTWYTLCWSWWCFRRGEREADIRQNNNEPLHLVIK